MKCFLIIILLFVSSSYAQPFWQQVPNLETNFNGERFDDVFFLTENIGWAANGSIAAVYKTTDGGINWIEQLNENILNGNYYFRNIEFLNENIGFLGTLSGEFFKTSDGGENWTEVIITPNPPAICGLDTIGSSTIYGCGAYFQPAYIIKSIDSGLSWAYIDMSMYAAALVEVAFLDELNGFAAGRNGQGGIILRTTDGGLSWTEVFNSDVSGDYVWKLQVLYSNPNIIFGSVYSISPNLGRLIKSEDGGTTWASYEIPEYEILGVGFVSESKGWIGGDFNGLYETTDGGLNWSFIDLGGDLNKIQIINSTLAYAAGYSIYKFTEETLGINSIEFSDSNHLGIHIINNPVDDYLQFKIEFKNSNNLLIDLYSADGKFIKQLTREQIFSKSRKEYSFLINDLSPGAYILDFHTNSGRTAKKFIKS